MIKYCYHCRECECMNNDKVFQMDFGKIYGLLLDKAARKGRTKAEVDEVICWLTGYSPEQLEAFRSSGLCYGDFFRNAPQPNPNRALIKGVICGVQAAHRPVPRPGSSGGVCQTADGVQDQQGRHTVPVQQAAPAGADCGNCEMV